MHTKTARMTALGLALAGACLLAHSLPAQSGGMSRDSAAMGSGNMGEMDAMGRGAVGAGKVSGKGPGAAASLSGRFNGVAGRKATGGFEVSGEGSNRVLRLSRDFSVSEASDVIIVLSPVDATAARPVNLGRLRRATGEATFTIPTETDLAAYRRVLIWSRKLRIALAEAPLGGGDRSGMMHGNQEH